MTTFLSANGVVVTPTMVTIAPATYPVNGITSFRVVSVDPPRSGQYLTIAFGAIVMLISLGSSLSGVLIGAGLIALGVYFYRRAETHHRLLLGTAGGERPALVSTDRMFVDQVAAAVGQAIEARG